ncbi:molybdopterin-synthase adenylyltransferase MoeB [Pseudomonas sp. UBT]|uniref:molybdopterin-synthase adenylyltransferase MoeB n=1 Tax=Pseudomonas sp. UBT TaxID=3239198 RepID=UPI003D807E0A
MDDELFSHDEKVHYARHVLIKDFGTEGQARLKAGKVLVVGAGGLGCPALMYLAAAGVGNIGIVEDDTVDVSNLHRQLLFGVNDIGQPKGAVARQKLLANNPYVDIEHFNLRIDESNVLAYMQRYDVILDATDNFATKYLLNDACHLAGKPLIYASISQFEGQIAVFNLLDASGRRSANLRDIFPEPPPAGLSQNCGEAGVLGVLPGIVGSIQALEAIKILTGLGEPLANRMTLFDALGMQVRNVTIRHRASNPLSGDQPSIHHPQVIEVRCAVAVGEQYCISPQALEERLRNGEPLQLIDVRDGDEHRAVSLGGINIPLGELSRRLPQTVVTTDTVVYCKSGVRSLKALHAINAIVGEGRCRTLTGGLDAYVAAGCQERLNTCQGLP